MSRDRGRMSWETPFIITSPELKTQQIYLMDSSKYTSLVLQRAEAETQIQVDRYEEE